MTPHGQQPVPNMKHGLSTMKRAMRELADRAIDGRTTVAKALGQWKRDLINDLGGPDMISTQQAAIVDLVLKTKFLLDAIDSWLLLQPSLVDKRRRVVLPVVRERQHLADALARYLGQLGLERRARRAPSLEDYVTQNYGTDRPEPGHDEVTLVVASSVDRAADDQATSSLAGHQAEVRP
jgi:hypothetical protein